MKIKALEERSGLSRDTIRYYEKLGLLEISKKDRLPNNFKEYTEEHLKRLIVIKSAKGMGFTLNQIKTHIADWETGVFSYEEKLNIFNQQLAYIDRQMAELTGLKKYVLNKIDLLRNGDNFQVNI